LSERQNAFPLTTHVGFKRKEKNKIKCHIGPNEMANGFLVMW